MQHVSVTPEGQRRCKLLLVRVPEFEFDLCQDDVRHVSSASLDVPLGVTTLAAVLRDAGKHDVKILDLFAINIDAIREYMMDRNPACMAVITDHLVSAIREWQPDIVGFSALYLFQHSIVRHLSRKAKEEAPGAAVFLGGYCTLAPEILLPDLPDVDVVFMGEAELTLPMALDCYNRESELEKVPSIGFRRADGSYHYNAERLQVADFTDVPRPAYELLPLHIYDRVYGERVLSMMTSRSCPNACSFCASSLYGARGLRTRRLDRLVADLRHMRDELGMTRLIIRDDFFNGNKKHCKQFLRAIIEHGFVTSWCDSSSFHVNSLDEEFLDLCKASGCDPAIFAIESASQRVLREVMNKRVDLDHARRMVSYCHKIGLPIEAYFVIGNPTETADEILQTIELAEELGCDNAVFSIATPLPGTKYYSDALSAGLMKNDIATLANLKFVNVNLCSDEFSPQWLKDTQYEANMRVNFYGYRYLKGGASDLQIAVRRFEGVHSQYPFHVVAALLAGYAHQRLANMEAAARMYQRVETLLQDPGLAEVYGRFIAWPNPANDAYREWKRAAG